MGNDDRMVRAKEMIRLTGLSRTSIWRLEKSGDMPKRRRISRGAVGWRLSEILIWLTSRDEV
jgi:prophage regulatory protein